VFNRPRPALGVSSSGARRRRRWLGLSVLATGVAAVVLATPALATARVENWTGTSTSFHAATRLTQLPVLATPATTDGKALRLQLPARPNAGPNQGVGIASNLNYRYGTFGSRMRSADCSGQDHPGVVSGTFTYSSDHSDSNQNGIADDDEIDIEFLCGQPEVAYLTIWTDYSETSNNLRNISRAVNLRTGAVLSTCYTVSDGSPCAPLLPGENSPTSVAPIAGFNSAKQFLTYKFDWQPDHVTFYTLDNAGHKNVLWDYRGPKSRIPQKSAAFMQNVWYTPTWNPLNGPSHNQPRATTTAYIDTTFTPS
jgi:beta-glucanase (GH16 family)